MVTRDGIVWSDPVPAVAMRSYYWTDRFYNLIEVLDPDGGLVEVYINIASPLRASGDELHFVDHELDITKPAGEPARIIDQDEFEEAIGRYGYTPEFQARCWLAAEDARRLAEAWTIGGHAFRT
jgi:protein associated with RNAse G/E